jgi:hypothetical protein
LLGQFFDETEYNHNLVTNFEHAKLRQSKTLNSKYFLKILEQNSVYQLNGLMLRAETSKMGKRNSHERQIKENN